MPIKVERLSRALMRRSVRILDMEYKISEIAEELGATNEQILRLVLAGAPARKDARGRYWIHGTTFVHWLRDAGPKKPGDKIIFPENECYCVTCRAMVTFEVLRRKHRMVHGICPNGHKVVRFISLKQKGKEAAKMTGGKKIEEPEKRQS
jgi:hypothetical protein